MRGNLTGVFSQTPRGSRGIIRAAGKKAGLELLQASRLTSYQPARLSSGSNNACDTYNIDDRCSSTAAQCCNMFGYMDNPRSSCNSCAGNNHRIPDIHSSCIGMRGNRIRFRLVRPRLKPERQLVSWEPEPVQLLPMEVKEVFSYISPLFVRLRRMQTPAKDCIGTYENRASSPFIMNRIRPGFAVPSATKKSGSFQRIFRVLTA